jgi:hypothetical protein
MPRPHPREFRDDVVAVARKGEAPIAEIAKDVGISESYLRNWLTKADAEDGHRPGVTANDSVELRELKRRNRLLEQENEGCAEPRPICPRPTCREMTLLWVLVKPCRPAAGGRWSGRRTA